MLAIEGVITAAREAFRPPPKRRLSEWSAEYARLSAESAAEPGKWHNIPYQVGIADAFTDPEVEEVICMKSARVGWTKILNNLIGYHAHGDPCSIMLVQPTIEDAEGYSKEEIEPMIRDTPVLEELFSDEGKAKKSSNTILHKRFPGGILAMVGANSPRGFRRVSRRIVLFDEVDGYPTSAGEEGDPIKLGKKRAEYYWNRKIGMGSTPTVAEFSRIEKAFANSNQQRYFVACPHCDGKQYLKWGGKDDKFGIKWPEGEPGRAYYVCEHAGCIIEHREKRGMIAEALRRQQAGEEGIGWVATRPEMGKKRSGFHIWAAYSYSPNATWGHLAQEFLEAKDDPQLLKTFVNTTLGECWTETYTAKLGAEGLLSRVENYQLLTVPERGLVLTAGIDVQDNRLAVKVKAWGEGEETWLVNWMEIFGDPADLTAKGPWAQVLSVIEQPYLHETGVPLRVRATAVDTGGHYTNEAYMFCRLHRGKNIFAIKGSSTPSAPVLGKPKKLDINLKGQTIKGGVELRIIGTDSIKATVYGRIKRAALQGAGAYHWPLNISAAMDYFKQLTCEKQLPRFRNGHKFLIWIKKDGDRNEALDCEVYAYAALQILYTRINRNTIWLQAHKLLSKLKKIGADQQGEVEAVGPSPDSSKGGAPPSVPPVAKRKLTPPSRRKGGYVRGWKN